MRGCMPPDFYETLDIIRELALQAKSDDLDLAVDYGAKSECAAFKVQEGLIVYTRYLLSRYAEMLHKSKDELSEDRNNEVLTLLENVCSLFGRHPIHHVLEGRMAWIAKKAGENELPIPDRFARYSRMQLQPWNNPHLDYISIEDIVARGEKFANLIPPEYRK
ncbi:hypothetical protein J4401_06340 [Candidatus Woesearchaeota archaeon]|nr:hypothetical protein [Candidatus Woesearchaeota archaeon]